MTIVFFLRHDKVSMMRDEFESSSFDIAGVNCQID